MNWQETVIETPCPDFTIEFSMDIVLGKMTLAPDTDKRIEDLVRKIREAQAEVAFRAGEEKGCKEVVEWVEAHNLQPQRHAKESIPSSECPYCQWQDFKKSKGVE